MTWVREVEWEAKWEVDWKVDWWLIGRSVGRSVWGLGTRRDGTSCIGIGQ